MKRLFLLRLLVIAGFIGFVEALCRIGIIDNFTMPPPSRIAADLARAGLRQVQRGDPGHPVECRPGFLHGCDRRDRRGGRDPPARRLADVTRPVFRDLLCRAGFGLLSAADHPVRARQRPKVIIAFMLGVVAVIVNTLNGLDRVPKVLLKSARMARMNWFATATQITLPSAAPFVLTGVKFAVAYALIGIIGSEFIMSTDGIGFEIAFAYNNFDNATMYPLIVLVMIISIFVNTLLSIWEKQLLQRRGLR